MPSYLHIAALMDKDFALFHDSNVSDTQISANIFATTTNQRPDVPAHRFSIGPLKQSIIRQSFADIKNLGFTDKFSPYKDRFLHAVERSRVVIVNGCAAFEKSSVLPVLLMEKCGKQQQHCKIICVEREQLLAIYYSERLAGYLSEKVGNTIAFQVHLQSRISETSNLIYTTASFLLRVLMGQRITDSFLHISHVIIDDVHVHEAYADILLNALREAMHCYQHLRIILLSNAKCNAQLLEYFGEGEEIRLIDCGSSSSNIYYAEEARRLVEPLRKRETRAAYAAMPAAFHQGAANYEYLDRCLDTYAQCGSQQALDAFLYMVHGEYASVNYRHSQTGVTAALIASQLGRREHLRTLLDQWSDPYVTDEHGKNVFFYTAQWGDYGPILDKHGGVRNNGEHSVWNMDANPDFIDVAVIVDLVRVLLTTDSWLPGGILIFMPCFAQLSRLHFSLLRHKLIGDLPTELLVHMLHSDIEKAQLERLLDACKCLSRCRSVVIATDIAETIGLWTGIRYVIDTARTRSVAYQAATYSKKEKYEIVSVQQLGNRAAILDSLADSLGACFRLIPKALLAKLPESNQPELLTMPLDRVCLTIKLLSPTSIVAEFLQNCINTPPFINVFHATTELKQIGIFDEVEEVTWLGCRLIDVPISCRLGKLLVFAILLQCLDPVLTIVSFLSSMDPLALPDVMEGLPQPFVAMERQKKKEERKRLGEDFASDHLVFIRLYQEWQNELREECSSSALVDEHHFVFNCFLERICELRTHLVGALRSSQLIHNQGHLSMHPINLKSNCWSLIKAALVSGLYPSICMFDQKSRRLKSGRQQELIIHPSSVLREFDVASTESIALNLKSPWIVYTNEVNCACFNSISYCTMVTAITVALFAGNPKISPLQTARPKSSDPSCTTLFLNDWISFRLTPTEAQFVLKMREHIHNNYTTYLQNCGNPDFSRRNHAICPNMSLLCSSLEKILVQEDCKIGCELPENVGLRPKAVPNKFLLKYHNPNAQAISAPKQLELAQRRRSFKWTEKHYFIIQSADGYDANWSRKYCNDSFSATVRKVVDPFMRAGKVVYAFVYSRNPDHFHTVVAIEASLDNSLRMRECFKNKILFHEFISICLRGDIGLPSFNDRRIIFKVDKQIGAILLELFAFRNNWIHALKLPTSF